MLYSWTVSLPDETKIAEAYQMLKLQGETYTASKMIKYTEWNLNIMKWSQ